MRKLFELTVLCFGFLVSGFSRPLHVDVKATSAVVMNAETGKVLYEKKAHEPFFPASTTKIATAFFILSEKELSLNQILTVSSESLKMRPSTKNGNFHPYWWDVDGTRMWLKVGEKLTVDALLHGLMMVSGDDAANVLAEGCSGSIPVFVEEMNEFLQKIGCKETHFINPHGCHHPEHVTTAFDLCLMTKEALKIPKFRELVSVSSYVKLKTNKQGTSLLKQYNQLLDPTKSHYYPKAIGVKTGFHSAAQNCLVAAAVHEGRTLIASILGCSNRKDRYKDAVNLLEAAFSETQETRQFFKKGDLFKKELLGAKTELQAILKEGITFSYFPAEEPKAKAFISWEISGLPIQKGQKVGEVCLVDENGALLTKSDLFAVKEVRAKFFYRVKEWFTPFIKK